MKNKMIFKNILAGLIVALLIVSCKENEPKGDEFSWSPDGKKLAMVNVESKELLIFELENAQIKQVTPIDRFSGEKAKIYMPSWSHDGQFLIYAKSSKTSLEILTYAIAEHKLSRIDRIPFDEKQSAEKKVFVSWSPKMNRIIWLSWNNLAEHRLFSALPEGKDKKLLIKLVGEKVITFPVCSPDGEWIVYSIYRQKGHKNNGLWKMKFDGSENQQIFPANEITTFQWRPDGMYLAVVQKVMFQKNQNKGKSSETKYHFKLSLIDSNGKNENLISEEEKQILELSWSPDGKQLAFFQQQDSTSDVWVVDLASNQKVKLNFNKVQEFFGWGGSNQIFYTTDYPDKLVEETREQKDARELVETLRGALKENKLIKSEGFHRQNQDDNISSFAGGGQEGAVAYYKSYKPCITSNEVYCPVIQFSNGENLYLGRTKAQYIAAADECYLHQNYQASLNYLRRYWDQDPTAKDFQDRFDMEKILEKLKTDPDSSQYEQSTEALNDGTIIKTILTMRKLNRNATADWLWNQLQKLISNINLSSKDQKEIFNEIFWSLMSVYSKYNELTAGINDLDRLQKSDKPDSNLIAFTNYAQAILAIQGKQHELGLQKMETAIKYLPADMAELDDISEILTLCLSNKDENKTAKLVRILQETIRRFPDNKNIFQIYDMLGNVYLKQGQMEKALGAYQQAVVLNFDQHEIWNKILETNL